MQHNNHKFLNVHTVSERYQVTVPTIWRWTRNGNLPKPVRVNGSTRWRLAELSEWETEFRY